MAAKTFRLKRRLTKAAIQHMGKAGLSLTPACEQLMGKLIGTGIKRMEVSQVVEDESKIRLAEDNLKKLIIEVRRETSARGTFPIVEENSIQGAFKKLQSLWPYS
ncbi:MAG TPA: hypothetical protein ENI80_02380 [Acidiferrobacteraceae bacterium]|nr:hypothetical protein [Acidiferrobacteraceae bacterium]